MSGDKNVLFTDTPVKNAVLTLAIPTVISQLITVVYNMADTFFIGQLKFGRSLRGPFVIYVK